jgi:hypothetical protein
MIEVDAMTEHLLIRPRKVQTEALSEALDSLGPTGENADNLSQEVEWLIEDCVRTSGRLKAAFDRGQRRWTARPVEDIHEFYTEFLGIVDRQLRLAGRVRDRALKAAETSLDDLDLKALDESILALIKLKEEVVSLCEWLIAPSPPSDEPHLSSAEIKAAFERGEYEYAGDILNRLLQGGPLIKE